MARYKNGNWSMPDAGPHSCDVAQLAVLMDIRDELQTLNRVLACPNFQAIPTKLDRISMNTHRPRRRRKSTPKI